MAIAVTVLAMWIRDKLCDFIDLDRIKSGFFTWMFFYGKLRPEESQGK